jgi:ADP-ribose pyrophosphatase
LNGKLPFSSGFPKSWDSEARRATILSVYQSRRVFNFMEKQTIHYKGRFLSLLEKDDWEYVTRSNASKVVALVAVTADDEIILVEQYRKPVERYVIEIPAGLVGDHDDPDEPVLVAAARELEEETGYSAAHLELLMECPGSAGMSDEIISFVVAHGLQRIGPGGGDDTEDIVTHVIPLASANDWLCEQSTQGKMLDPKVFAALHWLQSGVIEK